MSIPTPTPTQAARLAAIRAFGEEFAARVRAADALIHDCEAAMRATLAMMKGSRKAGRLALRDHARQVIRKHARVVEERAAIVAWVEQQCTTLPGLADTLARKPSWPPTPVPPLPAVYAVMAALPPQQEGGRSNG